MIRNIVVVVLLFTSLAFMGQRSSSSPYSYFGIGDEFTANTVEQSSMGGIGVAFSHYKYLNFTNPAAYGNLRYTTYGFGLLNNDLTIKTGDDKQSSTSTSLSYIALAFPIGKSAGFSFGLQPISTVGYSLSNSSQDADGNTTEISLFEGNGGVNRFHAAFGIKVYKGLSLGIEGDYNFGNIENSITNQIADVSLATKYREKTEIDGLSLKIGAQYEHKLKNNLIVNAGASVKLGNDIDVKGESLTYSLTLTNTGGEFVRDTLADQNGDKLTAIDGAFKLPINTIIGVGVGELDKWYAGVEYENQDAITTSGLLANTNGAYRYGSSNRISLGGFYLPKINSISSYWNRVTYRAGFSYKNTGLLVDGSGNNSNFTDIKDFGISFGLGIPLKQLSTVNMGFEFGKRGTTDNNLIEENYFNFRLSLSLTDNWFVKRKID
ncbi:hypothetical protein BW723_01295 [Polaribacter reichenbachii]|uniref:Outer membrane protein beta-barrel domain-containing protein n=1 Tax=Polaribacter reichenbachii TaxID=996801 RepID=A0A1B8TW58_9FLAO|nr:hypothetical protein [Polaribacter reichenbachii]APZ45008.1 hypothetical protein BW723_01295 [Polaribacter reichenbachii]AUC18871.1 hypothetical protein BTO17_09300 [Polaribacter reichenbachii]OBY63971.1 hypothetical protein LPB301_14395 [Polaribacter reichenbachii]